VERRFGMPKTLPPGLPYVIDSVCMKDAGSRGGMIALQ
jgi:hypothetical protein